MLKRLHKLYPELVANTEQDPSIPFPFAFAFFTTHRLKFTTSLWWIDCCKFDAKRYYLVGSIDVPPEGMTPRSKAEVDLVKNQRAICAPAASKALAYIHLLRPDLLERFPSLKAQFHYPPTNGLYDHPPFEMKPFILPPEEAGLYFLSDDEEESDVESDDLPNADINDGVPAESLESW